MEKYIILALICGVFAIHIMSSSVCLGETGEAKENPNAIQCFNCSSNFLENGNQDPCILGDEKRLNVSNCTGATMACVKVYTRLYQIRDGGVNWDDSPVVVSRFCDVPGDYDLGCTTFDANKGDQQICFCDKDKCNGGNRFTWSFGFVLLAGLVAVLMV